MRLKSTLVAILAITIGLHTAVAQQNMMTGRLVLKIAPAYRGACSSNAISIGGLTEELGALGVYKLEPKYKNAPVITPRQLKENNRLVDLSLVYDVYYSASVSPDYAAQQLARHEAVVYAEPEYILYPLSYSPNDPLASASGSEFLTQIKAREGWEFGKGSADVVIAVIDASCNWEHPDLVANLHINSGEIADNGLDDDGDGYIDNDKGWDFVGPDGKVSAQGTVSIVPDNDTRVNTVSLPPSSSLSPSIGHGTWTTGLAAATTDNNEGIASTGFFCSFLPLKLMHDYNGQGLYFTSQAIYYAATHDADVINLSLGSTTYSSAAQDVINFATFNEDVAVVAAAGNGITESLFYPASYDNVLSVTSVNSADALSNVYSARVDVCAPGSAKSTNIDHQKSGGPAYYSPPGSYTSLSSPMVAGLVGLVRAKFPGYTAQQAMERVRATADDIYAQNTNPLYQYKLGKGRVNFLRALTVTTPSVRLQSYTLNDGGDGVLDNGETFNLLCSFKNFVDPTTNLTITITTTSPYVTALNTSYTVGAMATNATASNTTGTFRYTLAANIPLNHTITFLVTYQDGVSYSDFELISLTVNPSFINLFSGNTATSIGVGGKWGNNPYTPNNWTGVGYQQADYADYLWEGGFLLGNSATYCPNNLRLSGGKCDSHFVSIQKPKRILNPEFSDDEVYARFSDAGMGINALGITVDHTSYGFEDAAFQNILIHKYVINNPNPFTYNNMYAAMAADWDYQSNALQDTADYDVTRRMLYSWGVNTPGSRNGCNTYIGMVLLTDNETINAHTLSIGSFTFNMANKFTAISSGTTQTSLQGVDVMQMLGIGPFGILPVDKKEMAIAIVSGCSLAEIQQLADTAVVKYGCMFKDNTLSLAHVPTTWLACDSVTIDATTAGAASYRWQPGSFSASAMQTLRSSGQYGLYAFDADGCAVSKQLNVTIVPTPVPALTLNDTLLVLDQDDQLVFNANPGTVQNWTWNFGDGFGFAGRSGVYSYQAPGMYTLTLKGTNGSCDSTIDTTVHVVLTTARHGAGKALSLAVYPNPNQDGLIYLQLPIANVGGQLTVTDVQGRTVYATIVGVGAIQTVQLPVLPAGMYHLQLNQQGQLYSDKLLLRP